MAIPMNRFTVAVANFCDSGAVVPNGNRTATSGFCLPTAKDSGDRPSYDTTAVIVLPKRAPAGWTYV